MALYPCRAYDAVTVMKHLEKDASYSSLSPDLHNVGKAIAGITRYFNELDNIKKTTRPGREFKLDMGMTK